MPRSRDDSLYNDDNEDDDGSEVPCKQQSGRKKIKIEYIQDKNRRHITFSKRKAGIMKKAYELSTLTGTQILLLIVSETGLVYTFTTPKLQPIVAKSEGKNLIQACLNAPDDPPPPPIAGNQEPASPKPTILANKAAESQPSALSPAPSSSSSAAAHPSSTLPSMRPSVPVAAAPNTIPYGAAAAAAAPPNMLAAANRQAYQYPNMYYQNPYGGLVQPQQQPQYPSQQYWPSPSNSATLVSSQTSNADTTDSLKIGYPGNNNMSRDWNA
ncbi:hypothetical protein VTP01DRAFT_10125 [Rhizomucor pusillus]|uniref:uncharacterized protein n=1 Tax=Rhizomucor pusillus TaxID=4840 RepID=UPI0037443D71